MSDFSSLTHKFRANLDNQQQAANKVSKRNRQPLSCAPCRIKKLKCDRGHPCDTCIKRGDQASCAYGKTAPVAALSNKVDAGGGGGGGTAANRARAQERLHHLEQLVMQMVDNSATSSVHRSDSSAESKDESSTSSLAKEGHLQYGSSESNYVGSTHWSAIFENIQELKLALGSERGRPSTTEFDESEDLDAQDPEGLFGSTGHLSLDQILSQGLPPRLQVDRRLSTYFNSRYMSVPFIHTMQFRRQYDQFWRTPLETPPLWVSILFSICCISATYSEAVGSEPSTPEDQLSPRMTFLNGACQCLRLGGFTKPKRYVVEALGLYTQCKYMATLDPSREAGVIFPMLVRLAYRSGYHRDPSHFPIFSVFEGEMRRRAWAQLMQFDLMVSFQLGLPNQVPPNSWDTLPPRNVLDGDFDEDSTVLPPSRSETEATPLLYFIVKSRLMASFGKICNHALSFRNYSLLEIMELDAELRKVYETVPQVLRIRPMSESFADPSYLIMVRVNCEFLFQKSLLVLHRKYMAQGNYPASSQACTDAATAITKHMLDLHKEFKPGGQLYTDRWMLSSFTMNDFYLATMLLCLGLSLWKKSHPGQDVIEDEKVEAQYSLLRSAFEICQELSTTSRDAKRVADVLQVVFAEIATSMPTNGSNNASSSTWTPQPRPNDLPRARFRGSAFFPTPYDVNLAPLTLDDRGSGNGGEVMSNSSSSVPASEPNQVNISNFNVGIHPLSFQASSSGPVANTNGPGINPFMSFLPFSPFAHTPSDPLTDLSESSQRPSLDAPMNFDVDWAYLDQWLAVPNPEIVPLNQTSRPIGETSPPSFLAQKADGTVGDGETDWTSTPYMFLGGSAPSNDGQFVGEQGIGDQDGAMNMDSYRHSKKHGLPNDSAGTTLSADLETSQDRDRSSASRYAAY